LWYVFLMFVYTFAPYSDVQFLSSLYLFLQINKQYFLIVFYLFFFYLFSSFIFL